MTRHPARSPHRLRVLLLLLVLALPACTGHSSPATGPAREKLNPNNDAESTAVNQKIAAMPGVVRVDGGYARNASTVGDVTISITVDRGTKLEPFVDAALKQIWLSRLSPCWAAIINVGTDDNPPASITRNFDFQSQEAELTKLYGARPGF